MPQNHLLFCRILRNNYESSAVVTVLKCAWHKSFSRKTHVAFRKRIFICFGFAKNNREELVLWPYFGSKPLNIKRQLENRNLELSAFLAYTSARMKSTINKCNDKMREQVLEVWYVSCKTSSACHASQLTHTHSDAQMFHSIKFLYLLLVYINRFCLTTTCDAAAAKTWLPKCPYTFCSPEMTLTQCANKYLLPPQNLQVEHEWKLKKKCEEK